MELQVYGSTYALLQFSQMVYVSVHFVFIRMSGLPLQREFIPSKMPFSRHRRFRRPLVPFFAFLVVALEVFEALAALEILRRMQRWKDFLAGPQSRRDGAAPLFFCFCSLRPARLESFGGRCIAMGSNAGTKPMNTAISLVGHEVVVMRPQYEKCSRSVAMC